MEFLAPDNHVGPAQNGNYPKIDHEYVHNTQLGREALKRLLNAA